MQEHDHAGIAEELMRVIDASSESLRRIDDAEASATPFAGKWSKKEVLGHLIDSAANNHHRFVRAQQVEEFSFPRYEQEEWVAVQGYSARSWPELIELWRLYNRHLAHVIKRIPEEKLKVTCKIGPGEPVSLGFLVEDYLVHLKHHLRQLGVMSEDYAHTRSRNIT